jgi:hypothetical protein
MYHCATPSHVVCRKVGPALLGEVWLRDNPRLVHRGVFIVLLLLFDLHLEDEVWLMTLS